jgi:glycosyltransferase involved in cell wall biosynthesis
VRCLRIAGVGSPGARSAALEIASGEVIALLDDDNIMLPGWLAAVAWAFSHFGEFDVLYGARVVEDEIPIGSLGQLPHLAFSHFDRNRLLHGNYVDASVIAHRANLPQAPGTPRSPESPTGT